MKISLGEHLNRNTTLSVVKIKEISLKTRSRGPVEGRSHTLLPVIRSISGILQPQQEDVDFTFSSRKKEEFLWV